MIQSTCVCLCIPIFTCDIWLNLSKPLVHPTVTPLASLSKRPISPRALGKNSWLIQNWRRQHVTFLVTLGTPDMGPLSNAKANAETASESERARTDAVVPTPAWGLGTNNPPFRFVVANRVHPSKWWKATVSINFYHIYIVHDMYIYYIMYYNYLSINCISCKFLAAGSRTTYLAKCASLLHFSCISQRYDRIWSKQLGRKSVFGFRGSETHIN